MEKELFKDEALLRKAKMGDQEAVQQYFQNQRSFIRFFIDRHFSQWNIESDDVIGQVYQSYIQALKKFKFNRKVKFTSYWRWYILHAVQEYVQSEYLSTVCLGHLKSFSKLVTRNQEYSVLHLDALSTDMQAQILPSSDMSDQLLLANEYKEILQSAMTVLTKREKYILIKRYGLFDNLTYTLERLGTLMGFTKERIRQIENQAIQKLSNVLTNKIAA